MRAYLSHTDDLPGSKISNAPENDSFTVPFLHLEFRKDVRKISRRREEARQGSLCDWIAGQLTRLCVLLRVVIPRGV